MSPELLVWMMYGWGVGVVLLIPMLIVEGRMERAENKKSHHS